MIVTKQQRTGAFTRWYDDVVRRCLATLGMHPEAYPIAGYWQDWFLRGLSPEAALAEFQLQMRKG